MNTKEIQKLAETYRLYSDKRPLILREIYKSDGKAGIHAFALMIGGKSAEPYLEWAKLDYINKKRSRRQRKLIQISDPPSPE